jgi:mono/diheme cytochrome c family protein
MLHLARRRDVDQNHKRSSRRGQAVKLAPLLVVFGCLLLIRAQDAKRTVWEGSYNETQAERGKDLYNQHCASCHSDTLMGGEQAPPLAGGEFLANWNELTVGDLFERVRTTMPIGRPGKLSRQVNADIIAYMLKANKFPAGQTEMARETEVLKQIRISSEKPDTKK